MDRRKFLRNSTLAGASLATAAAGCNNQVEKEAQPATQNAEDEFALSEMDIREMQRNLENGRFNSVMLTELYLKRIAEIDKAGPGLNAVIELNPDAVNIARNLDKEREDGKIRGPLHGIPVLIKDNIDTADRMQTTAGSLALEGHRAKTDAFIVTKLRDAGAVLLGKTNLSEWANFRSSNSCSGWSSRGGQTRSPYLLSHNPCGSSSGSGVAAAANLCAFAIGTETDGSITCPSSVAALVGLKPTVGLLSRSGIIPISHTQDTPGPMARTVMDAAIVLSALTGTDEADKASMAAEGKAEKDYTEFLDTAALNGKRIGIEKNPQGTNHYMHALQQQCRSMLEAQGAVVVDIEYLDKINALGGDEFTVLKYEFKDGLNRYLATATGKVKSLTELIAFNAGNPDSTMPYFRQETLEASDKLGTLDDGDYKKALDASFTGSRKIIDEVMRAHQLDAISGLTMGPSCAIDLWYGDRWGDVFLTQPAAVSGYPHITVPAGSVYGLPVGFSFFGKPFTEGKLLGMAYAFEQVAKARKTPQFLTRFEKV